MSDTHRLRADHVVGPDGVLQNAMIEVSGDQLLSCEPSATPAEPEWPNRGPEGCDVPAAADNHDAHDSSRWPAADSPQGRS